MGMRGWGAAIVCFIHLNSACADSGPIARESWAKRPGETRARGDIRRARGDSGGGVGSRGTGVIEMERQRIGNWLDGTGRRLAVRPTAASALYGEQVAGRAGAVDAEGV